MIWYVTLLLAVSSSLSHASVVLRNKRENDIKATTSFNSTYPLTPPISVNGLTKKYKMTIISDMDRRSRVNTYEWRYKMRKAMVSVSGSGGELKVEGVEWQIPEHFTYDLSQKGRAMEMSELKVFNGKLYTCDDKTGVVYELVEGADKPLPFVRLNDADGRLSSPFKCEWMSVKDQELYIGSNGQEYIDSEGHITSNHTFWVKRVNHKGEVVSEYWHDKVDAIRNKNNNTFPGYFVFEAVNWSEEKKKWFFLPRRESTQMYEKIADESRASNKLFIVDELFTDIQTNMIGELQPQRAFAAFKFIPGSNDEAFVALKTVEVADVIQTWFGAYTIDGRVLYDLEKVADEKYEGLEFI